MSVSWWYYDIWWLSCQFNYANSELSSYPQVDTLKATLYKIGRFHPYIRSIKKVWIVCKLVIHRAPTIVDYNLEVIP